MLDRRALLLSSLSAALGGAAAPPIKIGHRQASMVGKPTLDVFELAARIPGLAGVELQVVMKGYSLWDRETALSYKRAADRWGLRVPSLAGIWPGGRSLVKTQTGEECYRKSIEAAELLGASVILVAGFRDNCPKMDDAASHGPVIELLKKMAPVAANAGVTLGLETSLGAEDCKKLIDAVNHPAVRVFWDLDNLEFYGHKGESITGLDVLGAERICQVHCKNEDRLLEQPGRVDWAAALKALKRIGYQGWYVFETRHSGPEQCVEATRKNIEFLKRQLA
ncbi:MAG TPA: sugar phosphate isomerase/epimerase family protein [Bryobacteraceae bacterium]|nr:sugar phosphate isomerase/epimerase family protein [Bryobacteraceae bacterium]